MRVAIPSKADNIDSPMDERFARCVFFCIYDTGTGDHEFISNTVRDLPGGVGPQAVELLAKNNVQEVYAGEVGPKAESMLNRMNIKINIADSGQSVKQIIDNLKK